MKNNPVDILLVEDNINDAELTIRELRKYNMVNNMVHVQDGEEALDFIYATGKYKESGMLQSPKLILLDLQLPKITGMEVLQKIKSDPATKSIPVVMLTSSKEDPDILKCYELGANSYIVKPVNFDGFSYALKSLGFYWLLLNEPPQ